MPWITSEEALATLGTKPQSLYASVSRGRIRARPDPDDPRRRLYDRDDIDRLAHRAAGRRKAETVAADAIRWGDPVLETAISTVADGRLYYRGNDAVQLADRATLEDIAGLLWETSVVPFTAGEPVQTTDGPPLQRMLVALAQHAAMGTPAADAPPLALRDEAGALLGLLAGAATGIGGDLPVHRRLAAAWHRPEAAHQLRRALVLLAEHELNPSTFAARIAASTGAPLAAVMLAGLAVLSGPRHGGAAARIAVLAEIARRDGMSVVAGAARASHGVLPGFGHPLYPEGDVRARALLAGLALPPLYAGLLAAGRDATGEEPNVDFALAALTATFGLPPEAPLLLLALARAVGWLAHAMEQIASDRPIRPRARYVGNPPVVA